MIEEKCVFDEPKVKKKHIFVYIRAIRFLNHFFAIHSALTRCLHILNMCFSRISRMIIIYSSLRASTFNQKTSISLPFQRPFYLMLNNPNETNTKANLIRLVFVSFYLFSFFHCCCCWWDVCVCDCLQHILLSTVFDDAWPIHLWAINSDIFILCLICAAWCLFIYLAARGFSLFFVSFSVSNVCAFVSWSNSRRIINILKRFKLRATKTIRRRKKCAVCRFEQRKKIASVTMKS